MSILTPGDPIRACSGTQFHIDKLLGIGSQADVYLLRGGRMVFKRFRDRGELARVRWLVNRHLPADLPLALPAELVDDAAHAGYFAPFASGCTLAELMGDPTLNYADSVCVAHGVMDSLARIHAYMAHGDVREENIYVLKHRDASGVLVLDSVIFIDADNYAAKGAPLPLYVGDTMVMAPELRSTLDPRFVSCSADVYAAAQIIHLLLLRHNDSSFVKTPAEFDAAMKAGHWHSDVFGTKRCDTGLAGQGFRAEMLDSRMASLFRGALQADSALRPTARQFADHLFDLLTQGRIVHCPHCKWPMMLEPGITRCVHGHCGKAFDQPKLMLPGGRQLAVAGSLVLGRADLGSDRVSKRHLLVSRAGPLVCVRDLDSTNGTCFREDASAPWRRLDRHAEVYLCPHPRDSILKAAGVELMLRF